MDTNDPAQSIEIDQLGYTAELESRTETSLGNAGATNGYCIWNFYQVSNLYK
jgi:hypothetical protein